MASGSMPIIGPRCRTWRKVCIEMVSTVLRGIATPASAKASSMRARIGVPTGYRIHGRSTNCCKEIGPASASGWRLLTTMQNGSGASGWKS
ncbi:hypothetical protein D3C81_1660840 [compost metagenome]